jgi:23S rRNA (uridine2552-2'-O)-methyltransferase
MAGRGGDKRGGGGRAGGSRGGRGGGTGSRSLTVRVKTAKRRKTSSTRWLQRQLNDPYVEAARREGYRSRAAFKLQELDDRYKFLHRGARVVDLGASPGGWTQIALQRVGERGHVIAVDINEMEAVPGAEMLIADVSDEAAAARIREAAQGRVDVVLSDMAPPATGHRATDHLRIIGLVEAALELAREILKPGGTFVAKVWQGGTEAELLAQMKRDFTSVRHAKPAASRADSAEIYVVAQGFRSAEAEEDGED